MCPDRPTDAHLPDDESADTGQPVSELELIEMEPSDQFLEVVHRKIDRKVVVSHFFSAGWTGLSAVFLQYLKMIFQILLPDSSQDDQP